MPRTRATVCRWRASNATRTIPRLSALVDSVIVPTYNEAAALPLLVERLAPAMRDRERELVVVDDGPPEGTADVAEKPGATHPARVCPRTGKPGLASARNRAREEGAPHRRGAVPLRGPRGGGVEVRPARDRAVPSAARHRGAG